MKIGQTTIEKLAWWVILLLLLINIATFVKLTSDDAKKFKILTHNQNTLICIVRGFNDGTHQQHTDFIDNCVRTTP